MTNTALKLRGGMEPPKCAVAGCNEVPSQRLERIQEYNWCKLHHDLLRRRIAERDYLDFVGKLREQGVKKKLSFLGSLAKVSERRCCVQGCTNGCTAICSFEPYIVPGVAPICDAHIFALNYATQRMNPHRVIHEMAQARKGRSPDRYADKRRAKILELCGKHSGSPNYIEKICVDLQRSRIQMPPHWLKNWGKQYGLTLGKWDWWVAYKSTRPRIRIQNYISGVCNPRIRPSRPA